MLSFLIYAVSLMYFLYSIMFYQRPVPNITILEIRNYDNEIITDKKIRKNVYKFLCNRLFNTKDVYKKYDEPLLIYFQVRHHEYMMYLQYISHVPNKKIVEIPNFMHAYIKLDKDYGEQVDITYSLIRLHGNTKNFYEHIDGCENNNFHDLFSEYRGYSIRVMNMYGEEFDLCI